MRQDGLGCREFHQAIDGGLFRSADQEAHLQHCESCVDWMLTQALERRPLGDVPHGFSARVMRVLPVDSLPSQPARTPPRRSHYGRSIGFASLLFLTVTMGFLPLLDPHGFLATGPMWTTLEMLAVLEAACIAFWLGRENRPS